MARVKKWIQKINMKRGAFTQQAKRHGMTPSKFADYVLSHKEKFNATTIRRALLAKTLMRMSRKRK